MQTTGRGGRPDVRFQLLDPMRGLAALWVFTFHYTFSDAVQSAVPTLMRVFHVGDLGVPMFFVISGYCLMASVRAAERDGESVLSFLRRRFMRIYPPYWCSIVLVCAIPFIIEGLSGLKTGTFVPPSADGNINYGFLTYGLGDWIRVLTLTQVFVPLGPEHSLEYKFTTINAVYWTLAIEFQFYLVMAVALALRTRGMLWLGLVTAVSLPMRYFEVWLNLGIFLPYWPMFAIGIATFLILERGWSMARLIGEQRVAGAVATMIAVGIVGVLVTRAYHVADVMFALAFGPLLWTLHRWDGDYRQALSHARLGGRQMLGLARILGLMSYSVYLLHGRLQFLAMQLTRQLLSPGVVFDLMAIALTCAMCWVFYLACERPFIRSRVPGRIARPALVPEST